MGEHTPGPWRLNWNYRHRLIMMPNDQVRIEGPYGGLIAALHASNWADKQDEANAKLIAKAWLLPELETRLRQIKDAYDNGVLQVESPMLDPEQTPDLPGVAPHSWWDEWLHHTRQLLALYDEQDQ